MRKHFLLLMLMALLPMAGWAQVDISEFTITIDKDYHTYDASAPSIAVTVKSTSTGLDLDGTDDYDVVYYNGEQEQVEASALKNVGTYYLAATGKGNYTGTTRKVQFNVLPATLNVTPAATGTTTKEYDGTTDKTDVTLTWSATGYVGGEDASVVSGELDWSYASAAVGSPTITYTGLTATNYNIEYATVNFLTISKRTMTTSMITPVTLSETYKGKVFVPGDLAVQIADGNLLTTSDYVIKTYSDEPMTSEVSSPKNAGTYYIGITAQGNYQAASTLAAGTFTINKANLTVKANDQSHVYNGTTKISDNFESAYGADKGYQFIGLVGDDTETVITGARTIAVADGSKTAAGEYPITPNASTFTQTPANYNIYFQPGTYTIEQADLTITADDKEWIYGNAEPTYTFTLSGHYSGDATAIGAAVTVGRAAGDDDALGSHDIVVTYDEDADVFANYTVTKTNGVLTINGGDIVVTVNPQTITYGDDEPNWANPTKGVDYFVNGLADADADKLVVTLTRDNSSTKNVGTYTVTASAEKPEGYASISFVNSTFTITKKTLNVTADQTLIVGQTAANLSTDACDIDGLASWDEADDVITLAFASGVTVDGEGKLTTATTYDDGIIIALTTAGSANYTLSATKGDLTVIEALVLNRAAKADFADPSKNDDAAVIAAADGNTVTATFGDFSMYGEKWYSLVLPFATSVKDISTAFGYALVDILDEKNSSTDDVTFKVHMGDIPANTPFIFKVYKAMNMNAATFYDVTIANPADASEVAVSDAAGNKFIGTYTGKNGGFDSATDYVFGLGESATTYQKASTTFYVRPLGAWITFNAAATAPRINIEELDGSFTTINVVANENAADGNNWYNVNGMKMESAPAQKGVYIRNGKKFVVK